MHAIRSYKDLVVWQKSIELVVGIYDLTKTFPGSEKYGLCSQMQRAAVSIAANIAEGQGRGTRIDYAHFLDMAHGSTAELQTLLTIVYKLSLCSNEDYSRIELQIAEVGKMLSSLRAKLRGRT